MVTLLRSMTAVTIAAELAANIPLVQSPYVETPLRQSPPHEYVDRASRDFRA